MPVLLGNLIIIFGIFFTLGKAFDLYLLKAHKEQLRSRLQSWWLWLDDQKIPNFPKIVANGTIKKVEALLGTKNQLISARFLFISIILSILLTSSITALGILIDGTITEKPINYFDAFVSFPQVRTKNF